MSARQAKPIGGIDYNQFDPAGFTQTPAPLAAATPSARTRRPVQKSDVARPAKRRNNEGSGGEERPASYRLPVDLLEELDTRTRALDLPIGLTVAEGIAAVLALGDDELRARIEERAAARPRPRLRRR